MADISAEIAAFQNAVYGEDVRGAMISLANKVNNESSAADATVDALKSDMLNIYFTETLLNGFDKNNLEGTDGYWSNSNGEFVSNSNYYACSTYAMVKPNTGYSSWYNNGTASLYTYICFYNSQKTFISGSNLTSSNTITSPSNARYVRISVAKARKETYVFCEGNTFNGYSAFSNNINLGNAVAVGSNNYSSDTTLSIANGIADAKATGDIATSIVSATNLVLLNGFDKSNVTRGYQISLVDGISTNTNNNYAYSNGYTLIKPTAEYSAWFTSSIGSIQSALYWNVYWYDAAKNYISGTTQSNTNVVTAPSNARYVRFTVQTSQIDSFVFCEGTLSPEEYKGFGYSVGDDSEQLTKQDLSYYDESVIVNGIVTNGDVVASDEPWFSFKNIDCVPYNVTIHIKAGWRLHLFYYIDGVQTSPTSGWWVYDSVTIPKDTPFSFYFQKTDASSATLEEARKAVHISGYNVINYEHDKTIPVHYYTGEKVELNKNKIRAIYKYKIEYEALSSGGLQACDLYNNVLFVCRGDDILMLYDYSDGTEIANLTSIVGHGNAFQFGHEKISSSDEFPVAYASPFFDTEDTAYTIVNKIYVSRSNSTLIKRYKLPIANAGYYGGACINDDDSTMYVVGFKARSYTDATGNALVVSKWNMKAETQNADGSYTPNFVDSFEIDFHIFVQGVKYINGKIFVCIAPHDSNNVFNSSILVVDPLRKSVVSKFDSLPITIKGAELEDCFLVPTEYGFNLGVLMANGRTQELDLD